MPLRVPAPAKLNRFLAILGRRADGFHDMELVTTVLEGVEGLTDTLEAEQAASLSLTLAGPCSEGLTVDDSNLVMRAWRLLEREVRRNLPASLRLEKRIPHGAGLGGGSSDAAAALRLGNELYGLGLGEGTLLALGAELGSDVPLFLLGGTVLGLGRGERVFPLHPLPLEPMLIVNPGLHVATPAVFRALALAGYPMPDTCPSLGRGQTPPWRNDLTGAAIWVRPELADLRAELLDLGGEPLLCGSGSSWAARFPEAGQRDDAARSLASRHPAWGIWQAGPGL
ncbi:MAG: 4-(cytidine 5'-diphospho)-2-C-methyl-D-erythritol kinase [Holophagaceae bacterium]|nr:4-(cytidine 5'-diphospho)-2-C-methyl-D-erythritol kinase [Holophagaceae bacterium]